MPPRRVFALALSLLVLAVACSSDDEPPSATTAPEPTGASTGPAATGSTAPAGAEPGGVLEELACSLPHEWLLRTWRGHDLDRGAEIQLLPVEPNFVGSGLPHVGPWDYAQEIPMFWFGPGHIAPAGVVERPVTLAGIALSVARRFGLGEQGGVEGVARIEL